METQREIGEGGGEREREIEGDERKREKGI